MLVVLAGLDKVQLEAIQNLVTLLHLAVAQVVLPVAHFMEQLVMVVQVLEHQDVMELITLALRLMLIFMVIQLVEVLLQELLHKAVMQRLVVQEPLAVVEQDLVLPQIAELYMVALAVLV